MSNNKGYIVKLPPTTSTRRLWALRRQRPSGTPSGATSSRSRRLWLRHHAATNYVNMPPPNTPSATTLGYSLGSYLELVTPSLATSSRCHQVRRHAAFGHSVGNDPQVLPRGLPQADRATSGYVVTLPPATSTCCLRALHRQRPSGSPSGATLS